MASAKIFMLLMLAVLMVAGATPHHVHRFRKKGGGSPAFSCDGGSCCTETDECKGKDTIDCIRACQGFRDAPLEEKFLHCKYDMRKKKCEWSKPSEKCLKMPISEAGTSCRKAKCGYNAMFMRCV